MRKILWHGEATDSGTLLVSVLTLCCSSVFCATGVYAVADQGRSVSVDPGIGIPMILLGLLAWIAPPLLWSIATDENGEDVESE